MRRAHEARVGLAGQVDVVAVAARAHEQARVFLAQDRLAESFAGRAGSRLEEGHARAGALTHILATAGITVFPMSSMDRIVVGWSMRDS